MTNKISASPANDVTDQKVLSSQKNLKCLVIGASKGIGKAILKNLEEKGYQCIGMSRTLEFSLDLSWDTNKIKSHIKEAINVLNGLDVLILSGGRGAYLGPLEATDKKMQELLQINFIGPVQCFYAAQKELIKSKGSVLFLGSTAARKGARSLGCYAASKAAIEGWVKSEARQYARKGVRINVLSPGWVDTEMVQDIKPDLKEIIVKSIPIKRMGTADEVAKFAVAIVEQSLFLTGEIIDISGGA